MLASAAATQQVWTPAEYLWVGGGVLLTLAIGLALLYWIDQEWRSLDQKQPRRDEPSDLPTENGPRAP